MSHADVPLGDNYNPGEDLRSKTKPIDDVYTFLTKMVEKMKFARDKMESSTAASGDNVNPMEIDGKGYTVTK